MSRQTQFKALTNAFYDNYMRLWRRSALREHIIYPLQMAVQYFPKIAYKNTYDQ